MQKTYYTYRFVIAPETIGVVAYLYKHRDQIKKVIGGTVITTVAGPGDLGLKYSFLGNHLVDECAKSALNSSNRTWKQYPFIPDGSDERQYSSPGFKIPMISITKDKYYEYPEYHTSEDNLDFVSPSNLVETLEVYLDWIFNLENNRIYHRPNPYCEFQLGKRGLFPNLGGAIKQPSMDGQGAFYSTEKRHLVDQEILLEAFNWLMHCCDGSVTLLEISKKSNISLNDLIYAAKIFEEHGLLSENM